MSDDDRISALFRAAASDAPEPEFDHAHVLEGSRRVTARRRASVLGGAVAALVVVVGVGAGIGLSANGERAADTAAGSAESAAAPDAPLIARDGPLGPGTGECADRQDPELRALVDAALPEVAGATAAATTEECRPGGERGVALEVDDGVLSVTYLPPGAAVSLVEGAVTENTASGGTVLVYSRDTRFADRVDDLARTLAPQL